MKGRVPQLALVGLLSVLLMPTTAYAQDILNCEDFDSQEEAQESLRDNPTTPTVSMVHPDSLLPGHPA